MQRCALVGEAPPRLLRSARCLDRAQRLSHRWRSPSRRPPAAAASQPIERRGQRRRRAQPRPLGAAPAAARPRRSRSAPSRRRTPRRNPAGNRAARRSRPRRRPPSALRSRPREVQLVVGREAPPPETVDKHRDPQRLGQLAQRILAAPPVQPSPRHDHRPLGLAQRARRPLELARSARATRRSAHGAGPRFGGQREHVIEREVEERRARVRRSATAIASSTRPWISPPSRPSPRASPAAARTARDRSPAATPVPSATPARVRPAPSIGELFCERRAERAHPVGHARARGQRTHAELARDLRPALGGERRRLLVADVDDLDALGAAAVVDREQMPAREREQLADAVGAQSLGDQPPAVELSASCTPPRPKLQPGPRGAPHLVGNEARNTSRGGCGATAAGKGVGVKKEGRKGRSRFSARAARTRRAGDRVNPLGGPVGRRGGGEVERAGSGRRTTSPNADGRGRTSRAMPVRDWSHRAARRGCAGCGSYLAASRPATAAASSMTSALEMSKPPQNASRIAASANLAPTPARRRRPPRWAVAVSIG